MDLISVCEYITAGLDAKIMGQVVYEHSLQTKSYLYQVYSLWKDEHLVCSCFHHLIMAAFMPT